MAKTKIVARAPISREFTVIFPESPRRTTVLVPLFFSFLFLNSIPAMVLDNVK